MKKFNRIMAVVLAVVLSATTLFAFAVSAEDVAGTEYKLGAMGTDNKNGAFTISLIRREKPEDMTDFDYKSDFKIADAEVPAVENGKFVDPDKKAEFYASTDAASKFNCRPRSGAAWVITFTAPVAGTYTISMDINTFAWGAAFSSVGNTDLKFAKEFPHQQADVFTETVVLAAGQTYNVGFTRVGGSISQHVPHQFEDEISLDATNFKVTLDEVGTAQAPATSDGVITVIVMAVTAITAVAVFSKKRR